MRNEPYVKQFDKNGVCTNPITSAKPYNTMFPNSSKRERNKKFKRGGGRKLDHMQLEVKKIGEQPVYQFTKVAENKFEVIKTEKVIPILKPKQIYHYEV